MPNRMFGGGGGGRGQPPGTTRGFGSVPNVASTPSVGRARPGAGPAASAAAYFPAAVPIVSSNAPVIVGVVLFGPSSADLRTEFVRRMPRLDSVTGERLQLAMVGDPRESGPRFRDQMRVLLGEDQAERVAAWEASVEDRGAELHRATEEECAREALGLDDDDLPCIVFQCTDRWSETPILRLPRLGAEAPESMDAVARVLGEQFAEERVIEFLADQTHRGTQGSAWRRLCTGGESQLGVVRPVPGRAPRVSARISSDGTSLTIPVQGDRLLEVSARAGTASVGNAVHDLTPSQANILFALAQAEGGIVTGDQLRAIPGMVERPDQQITRLPEELRSLIDATRGKGYRLKVADIRRA